MSDLDLAALEAWACKNIDDFVGPVRAIKIKGGQSNPTYRLDAGGRAFILRRKPPGVLLKSAHAVDREFRVQKALLKSAVPVARMHALCEDDTVIGSAFYIMDLVDGVTFDQPSLPDLDKDNRGHIMDAMNRVLVAIHDVDIAAVELNDFGAIGHYCKRQTDRWTKQYQASQTENLADMDALIAWLHANMPDDDGQRRLVHGDYRLDNLLFSPDGLEIRAVLDWELSTIGHPYADLAAVIMQWSMPASAEGRGLAGVDRSAQGLWTDQQFLDTYCQRRNLSGIENFNFYLAFSFFRMAAILQGVKKRAMDGTAADPERGARLGAFVPKFAKAGLKAAHS